MGEHAACVVCDTPTGSTRQARIGDQTGPCCPDCAEWCDGNLIDNAEADVPRAARSRKDYS